MAAMDRPIFPEYLDQPTIEDRLAALANAINPTPRSLTNKMPDLKLIEFHMIT
jgi:hypothetical protein